MELKYVYVPQRQYMIDGNPARTCGEWPGIKPNHWHGSLRVIRPNQSEKIFDRDAKIPLLGRRHFEERQSPERIFLPGKKQNVKEKYRENIEDKPTGLRRIDIKYIDIKDKFDKRHFPPRFGVNADPECLHIKTYRPDGNTRTTKETPIEREFGMKKKLWSLRDIRNGLPTMSPGDKIYKNVDHSEGFFKDGGLIVGSTNVLNLNKTHSIKDNNFYETLNVNMRTLNRNKLWRNKVKKEMLTFDDNYVKTLTNWEENILNDYLPQDPSKAKNDKDNKAGAKNAAPAKKVPPKKK